MSFWSGLIGVLMIVLLVMTFIQEPATTIKFGKAFITSGFRAVNWCIQQFKEVSNNEVQRNDTKQELG